MCGHSFVSCSPVHGRSAGPRNPGRVWGCGCVFCVGLGAAASTFHSTRLHACRAWQLWFEYQPLKARQWCNPLSCRRQHQEKTLGRRFSHDRDNHQYCSRCGAGTACGLFCRRAVRHGVSGVPHFFGGLGVHGLSFRRRCICRRRIRRSLALLH